ncbi:hypothetical protein RB653_000406 [Dictyostelium firmibasis]|uniref:CMP/dCMP-type deaminase domain-containing protein n=1 Tax=Dictyostelium firmibasis TaxID=79012 RepID=A0AAN7TV28_9MYCE
MIKQIIKIFIIVLLFTLYVNNVESKSQGVLGNCQKNQTAKYKKISSKHGNDEIKEITKDQLTKAQLDKHEMFMKIALEIAVESGIKFVSIIVSPDDRVLCSGTYSKENAILHSELVAITNCSLAYKMVTFENHTIYSTAEPDSLSASAIVWARFKQVVYGSSIKNLHCNACYSNLPIDSTYIFSRGYGIGVENIQLVAGILEDQTDTNFGSYCNSSISSIHKINPQCKCKDPKPKENNDGNHYHRRHHHDESNSNDDNKNQRNNNNSNNNKDDGIDNFFDEIKSGEDDFDKDLDSSKHVEKLKSKEKKKRHSHNSSRHSHTSKDGRSRTSTSTSVSGNGHATATATSSSSSTSFSHSHSSSPSNDHHHKKDKSKKNKDNKQNKEKGDKKDKKEKKDKKDKKDKSTSVEINTLKIEKNI